MKKAIMIILLASSVNANAQIDKYFINQPISEVFKFKDTITKYFSLYQFKGVDTIDLAMNRLKFKHVDTITKKEVVFWYKNEKKDFDPEMNEPVKVLYDAFSLTANFQELLTFIQTYSGFQIDIEEVKKLGRWYKIDKGFEYNLSRVPNSKFGYWTFVIHKDSRSK